MPVNSFEDYPMSWRPKILKKTMPLYLNLANHLESDIINGILKPNDKLPPQRELADFLDISLSTVTRAFKLCESKGLISGSIGRGTYVSASVNVNAPMLNDEHDINYIDLGPSHPLYSQNHYVSDILKKLPIKINVDNLLTYNKISGSYQQKESGQIWLKQMGVNTEIDNIVLTMGLQNSLAIILSSLFNYGDKIITNSVIYPGFKNIANMLGIILIPIPYKDKMFDFDCIEKNCKNEKIKGIYLMPDLHNPTTLTMNKYERSKVADLIKKYSLIAIEDGTYTFLNKEKLKPVYEDAFENTIYISSISNSISAGLRIAFLVVPIKYREMIMEGIRNINVMAPPLEAEIVSQLIRTKSINKIVSEKIKEIKERNKLTEKKLSSFELWGNHRSQFRWLILPKGIDCHELEEKLIVHKVKVFCSERFLVGSSVNKPALRLSICTPENIDELSEALDILLTVISEMIEG